MPAMQPPRVVVGASVIGLLIGSASVLAQTTNPVSEKDFLSDMPVVLSVSRLPQPLDETPGAVTVLDRETIRQSGVRDVADLLRLVPGFQVSTSFESVAPLVSYHGAFDSYSNRLELLIDGRSAYSSYFIGSIGPGLQTVAIEDIERVEVLRGSNSAAYGARAILGVINIVTRHTADTLGTQATLTAGENGIRDAQARIGWGNNRATFRLTVDRRTDDGLAGSNGPNRVARVNFRSDLHPTPHDELQLRLGTLAIDAGKGSVDSDGEPPRPTSFAADYAQVDWRRSLGPDEDILLSVSHSRDRYDDKYPYSLERFGINDFLNVEASGSSSSDALSLQHSFRRGEALRVVWGGEFRSENIVSPAAFATDSVFINDFSRLFGNIEWRGNPRLLFNLGAMAERSSVGGNNFAPRLMVNWHAAEGQTWRAGFSKAFRPPSTYENFANVRYAYKGHLLAVNTVSTGQVQAENVLSREIGFLGEFPRWGLGVDVRLFHEQLNGFVRQRNASLPRFYVNDEDFAIRGFEYQARWKPWAGAVLGLGQSYTDIRAQTFLPADPAWTNLSGSPFAAPRLANTITFLQKFPGQIDLMLTHQDLGTAALFGSGYGSRVAMTRTDLRLSKALRWGTTNGEIALVVQNLGQPYRDFEETFYFNRQVFVSLRLEH